MFKYLKSLIKNKKKLVSHLDVDGLGLKVSDEFTALRIFKENEKSAHKGIYMAITDYPFKLIVIEGKDVMFGIDSIPCSKDESLRWVKTGRNKVERLSEENLYNMLKEHSESVRKKYSTIFDVMDKMGYIKFRE